MTKIVPLAVMDYDTIQLRPLTGTIGAEVDGVDLRNIDDDTFTELHDAFLRYKVLFYRDQHLTDEEHLAFARRWGPLEIHPVARNHPEHPELLVLDSTAERGANAATWHSDVTFEETPPLGSILHGVIVPPFGGDTLFTNMELAYERLPDDVRSSVEELFAAHTPAMYYVHNAAARELPEQIHPVIRTHPETGRRSIYVNHTFTSRIEGVDPVESERLLTYLADQAKVPEHQCRFRWQPDSFAQWDNRCTQHYASADYASHRRMIRATIRGDRPR